MAAPHLPQLCKRVDELRGELVRILSDLIRIPTLNIAPRGEEKKGQEYLAAAFAKLGLQPDLYDISTVPALAKHPLRTPLHEIEDRWNLSAVLKGKGGGRSLILNGHMDTVPPNPSPWKRDPFDPVEENGRLYGLGSMDMKASLAAMYLLARVLLESEARLKGDLIFESVCDEEDGGVHGTLAQRLRGYRADGALVLEPSSLSIYNAHRGGIFPGIFLKEPPAGIQLDREVLPQFPKMLQVFLQELDELSKVRNTTVPVPGEYRHYQQPLPVWVCKVVTGLWSKAVPVSIASEAKIELYLQTVPGEPSHLVLDQFRSWLEMLQKKYPQLFPGPISWTPTLRQMEASSVSPDHGLIKTLAKSIEQQTRGSVKIQGSPAPCDMFVFNNHFDIPCVWFGPTGANAHAPDEYVEIESILNCVKCLLHFVGNWCEWA